MKKNLSVLTYLVSGLEVSSLFYNKFIFQFLLHTRQNIPQEKDLERRPLLKETQPPQIEGNIGLLIGTNVPKAVEPWEVESSIGNGTQNLAGLSMGL